MYQNIPTKVLTGESRLSYVHLSEKYVNPKQGGDPFQLHPADPQI